MTSNVATPYAIFSAFTLSLLKDTQFYDIQSFTLEELQWGKGLCPAITRLCDVAGTYEYHTAAVPQCDFEYTGYAPWK